MLEPNPDTSHLFINGADTSNNWGTLTIATTVGVRCPDLKCGALAGGTDQSHVLASSVRINALLLDNVTSQ